MEEAAVVAISGLTALDALTREAALVAGERVLVIGASGGVGSYAVQIARALGAEVAGVCSAQKAEFVRSLGASVVFDYRKDDYLDGNATYDVVIDIAGGAPVSRLRRALNKKGRLVFVGNENGGDFMDGMGRPLGALFLNSFSEQRFRMLIASEAAEGLERLAKFAEEGALKPSIDRRVPLEGVADAMRDLEAGRVRGKVAVTVR
jgi:NADPH:quinone reductase-like Zn-dependent oxidoreductase